MSLRDLYQEMILDHGKTPRNFGKLENVSHSQIGHNPLCGDKLTVYLQLQNLKVADIKFEGCGCAISVASASLMSETVKGKDITEIENIFRLFYPLVTEGKLSETEQDQTLLGKLAILKGVSEFPIRVKCATLAWHTLMAAINQESQMVSTE